MRKIVIIVVLGIATLEGAACAVYAGWVLLGAAPRGPVDDLLSPVMPNHLMRWACERWRVRFLHDHSDHCYHD